MASSPEKRAKQLRDELNHHNHLYYIEARPTVSDRDYDAMMQELIDLEKAHPDLATPDSPTQRVGGDVQSSLKPVKHAVPMMSIDNTYSEEEVRAFDARVKKGLDGRTPTYVLEPKIDGASVSLRYENGQLVLAATRGRGNTGDDITANAKTIQSIPLVLKSNGKTKPPPILEVRGEVYMDNEDFQKVNKELIDEGEEPYANPRNLTAGTLRRLDPKIVAKRRLRFLAHGLGQVEPLPVQCYWEWTQLSREWGLPLPNEVSRAATIDEVIQQIAAFALVRPTLPYMTDGVVVKVDDFAQRDTLGTTSKSPKWIIAYKYETEQQPTVLKDVRWQVGKGGSLTPVGDLEPVFIGGVTVTHVTLHNIDQIRKLDIHIGDTVVVERAGEVIPYVRDVIKEKRPRGVKAVPIPTTCPECQTKLEWEDYPDDVVAYRCLNPNCDDYYVRNRVKKGKVPAECPVCQGKVEVLEQGIDLYCVNPSCPAQLKERLRWYCGRSQMNIEGLGDRLIDQLVGSGKVGTFADLYKLSVDDIATLESETSTGSKRTTGEKTAQKIVANIETSKQQSLDRLLGGLGIHHVGTRVAHVLASSFGSLDALEKTTEEQFSATNEIGPVIAHSVADFFQSKAGHSAVGALIDVGVNPKFEKPPVGEQPLAGQSVVVTGTLEQFDRQGIESFIVRLGGKASGSVSKKTSFLVVGENAGSKLDKAKELGVKVLTEAEFVKEFGDVK